MKAEACFLDSWHLNDLYLKELSFLTALLQVVKIVY